MAGLDDIVLNTLEKPVSADFNDLQSMIHRNMLEVFRFGLAARAITGGMPTGVPRDVVVGGLEVTPSGNDVQIAPGILMQENALGSPTPGALDSPYRFATNRAAMTVAMPAPGSTTYYLVSAFMNRTVTVTDTRGVLNVTSGAFVPTLVEKQRERRLTASVGTGTGTAAPVPSAGQVPLAIVRRPGGGGLVAVTDIMDVRPMWADRFTHGNDPIHGFGLSAGSDFRQGTIEMTSSADSASNLFSFVRFKAIVPGAGGLGSIDLGSADNPTSATYLEPGTVLSANTWYYLYLCHWNGLLPWRGDVSSNTPDKGVLVLSASLPGTGSASRSNASSITLPSPFTYAVPASSAVLVAALRRNSANTGWVPMVSPDAVRFMVGPEIASLTFSPASAVEQAFVFSTAFPTGARVARIAYQCVPGAGIGATYVIRRASGGATVYDGTVGERGGTVIFDWPLRFGTTLFTVATGTAAGNIAQTMKIIGYEL